MVVHPSSHPGAAFVGRAAELERLRKLTEDAAAGSAAAVLLSGDAGVGKSSLIAEAARRAADQGLLVLLGRCVDLGTGALPYLPFAEALSQLVRAGESAGASDEGQVDAVLQQAAEVVRQAARERPSLARITGRPGQPLMERAPGDTGLDRLALFEAVAHVLGRIGDEISPLLVVIEDLHWADPSTRDLVRFLLARLGADRLLVIASYRGDDLHRRHPLRPLLGELLRLPQVQRMDLLPFGAAELGEFLNTVHGAQLDPVLLRRITERSAGNAYYAEELLAAGGTDQLPIGLADVLLDRLERLTPAGQQLVRMASVLGSARIDDGLLRGAVRDLAGGGALAGPAPIGDGDPGMEIEHAVREALAHQLLVPDGPDRYAFRHALLQEAVYADLLPGERVRRHAALAHRLAELGDTDEKLGNRVAAELARHSYAAHDLPLALAASLRAAAEAGRDSAPAQELAHYEQALQLWDAVDPDRRPTGRHLVEIAVAAADAAGDAGLPDRALHLASAALDEAQGAGPARLSQARAALALHILGLDQPLEAREQARQVVAELDDQTPSAARVLAWLIQSRVDVSLGEPETALDVIPAALAEAEVLGLLGLKAELLTTFAIGVGMVGRADVEQHWAAARSAAEQACDQAAMIRVLYNIAIDQVDRGDLSGAVELLGQALRVADDSGLTSSRFGAQARSLMITTRWQLGDAEGALAVVRKTDGSSADQLPAALARQLQLYALPVWATRDPDYVLSSGPWLMADDAAWGHQILQAARSEAFSWLGRWDDAADAARQALDFLALDPEPYPLAGIAIATTAVGALADAAAAARERGDPAAERSAIDRAAEFVEDARTRARLGRPRRFTMGPEGLAWLARLELEAARLRATDDPAGWAQVAEAFAGVSVFELARARWHRAELLLRAGQREPARAELILAHQAAVQLGATALIAALDELARRGRVEVNPNPAGELLTPREREVMALVAEGLTNRVIGERLFISEKTASVHVSNVLAKLGASGRTEAVAIIGRRGLLN